MPQQPMKSNPHQAAQDTVRGSNRNPELLKGMKGAGKTKDNKSLYTQPGPVEVIESFMDTTGNKQKLAGAPASDRPGAKLEEIAKAKYKEKMDKAAAAKMAAKKK